MNPPPDLSRRGALTLAEVNALDEAAFVRRFGAVFEQSPWVAARVWPRRPWPSLAALHAHMLATVQTAGPSAQLALIRAHPDLVGRAALTGALTRESTAEQRAAGLDPGRLSPDEITRFTTGNAAYQECFGFPFVIRVREQTKATILAELDRRLHNDPATEQATALAEIGKIAWLRLNDLVRE